MCRLQAREQLKRVTELRSGDVDALIEYAMYLEADDPKAAYQAYTAVCVGLDIFESERGGGVNP